MSGLREACYRLFVYGTLRPGQKHHERICTGFEIQIYPALVRGALYELPEGYPALTEGEQWIRGDVLCFSNQELLIKCDLWEEYDPNLQTGNCVYRRVYRNIYNSDYSLTGKAQTYIVNKEVLNRKRAILIPMGTWK